MNKQTRLVYAVLAAVWVMLIAWQVVEHDRVKRAAKAELSNRAKDISNTVGLVLGSQRHVITKERLESALNSLVKPEELMAVAMLNATGDIVASAGTPIDSEMQGLVPTGEHWGSATYALMNLVALGNQCSLPKPRPAAPLSSAPRNELFNSDPFRDQSPGLSAAGPRRRATAPETDARPAERSSRS